MWPASYAGCLPPEYVAKTGRLYVTPDGKWHHVRSSNCAGSKPTIYAEWPCEPAELTLRIVRGPLPNDVVRANDVRVHTSSDCVMRPRNTAAL